MLAGLAAAAWAAVRICRRIGTDPARALWMLAANPLVLVLCIVALHNETFVVAFMLLGLASAVSGSGHGPQAVAGTAGATTPPRRGLLAAAGWLAATVATAAKPTAAVMFPALAQLTGREHRPHPTWRYLARLAAMTAATLAVCAAGLAATGSSLPQWLSTLSSTPQQSRPLWFVPAQFLTLGSLHGAEAPSPAWATLLARLLSLAGLAVAAVLTLRRRPAPLSRTAAAFAVFLVTSTIIWPWYAVMLLALLAVSETSQRWSLAVSTGSVFLLTQALAGNFLETRALPRASLDLFNVLPGVLGVTWALGMLGLAWRRRATAARGAR